MLYSTIYNIHKQMDNHSYIRSLYQQWVSYLSLLAKQTDATERQDTIELLIDIWNEADKMKHQYASNPFLDIILSRDVKQHSTLIKCQSNTVVL